MRTATTSNEEGKHGVAEEILNEYRPATGKKGKDKTQATKNYVNQYFKKSDKSAKAKGKVQKNSLAISQCSSTSANKQGQQKLYGQKNSILKACNTEGAPGKKDKLLSKYMNESTQLVKSRN